MYNLLGVLQTITYLAIIVIALVMVKGWYARGAPRREHLATKARLNQAGVLEPDDAVSPKEAAQRNLRLLGLPSVDAGGHVINVPCFNPDQEGQWETNREVVATARVKAFTRQGADPLDMIELTGGYIIVGCGGKTLLLKSHNLTSRGERELEEQRQAAVDRDDGVIEDFEGHVWRISGAYGSNVTRQPGERACSYIQALSVHPRLGEPGLKSTLPPNLLDGEEHDYYDLRARNEDTGEILYFFYAGGKWNCYIGRLLTGVESNQMQGI